MSGLISVTYSWLLNLVEGFLGRDRISWGESLRFETDLCDCTP